MRHLRTGLPLLLLLSVLAALAEEPAITSRAGQEADALRRLEAGVAQFELSLHYSGPQDKPYYNLTLHTGARRAADRSPFILDIQISEDQARRIIAYLGQSGMLRKALAEATIDRKLSMAACYWVRFGAGDYRLDAYPAGFDLAMYREFEALGRVLEGEAAKALATLLGRLEGHRVAWEKAAAPPLAVKLDATTIVRPREGLPFRLEVSNQQGGNVVVNLTEGLANLAFVFQPVAGSAGQIVCPGPFARGDGAGALTALAAGAGHAFNSILRFPRHPHPWASVPGDWPTPPPGRYRLHAELSFPAHAEAWSGTVVSAPLAVEVLAPQELADTTLKLQLGELRVEPAGVEGQVRGSFAVVNRGQEFTIPPNVISPWYSVYIHDADGTVLFRNCGGWGPGMKAGEAIPFTWDTSRNHLGETTEGPFIIPAPGRYQLRIEVYPGERQQLSDVGSLFFSVPPVQ